MAMTPCPRCGHENLPSYTTCSRCGADLATGTGGGAAGMWAAASAADEYARLVKSRAAAQKRTRRIYFVVVLAAAGLGGWRWMQDRARKSQAQEKLAFFDRWADLDKRETGTFWNCVMASEVDINMFSNANQVQQRIESAYVTQQKTFAEHLQAECIPKAERAEQAFASLRDAPADFAPALQKYRDSLKAAHSGVEDYATNIQTRKSGKDVDALIQETGTAWHTAEKPTPEAIAYEKFIHCAVPGLAKMKDAQAMLEYLADVCYKKDPVAFMTRVRESCGPLLAQIDPQAKPSATWKLSQRFYEQEARQLKAWESCGKKARTGRKADDLAALLVGVSDYMQARADLAKTAMEIKRSAQ